MFLFSLLGGFRIGDFLFLLSGILGEATEVNLCCQCHFCGVGEKFRWFLRYRKHLSSIMSWAGPEDIYLSTSLASYLDSENSPFEFSLSYWCEYLWRRMDSRNCSVRLLLTLAFLILENYYCQRDLNFGFSSNESRKERLLFHFIFISFHISEEAYAYIYFFQFL